MTQDKDIPIGSMPKLTLSKYKGGRMAIIFTPKD